MCHVIMFKQATKGIKNIVITSKYVLMCKKTVGGEELACLPSLLCVVVAQ